MGHDNISTGNRIGNTFVYSFLSKYDGDKIIAAGFYRVDIHPDAATDFGAPSFDDWVSFENYESDNETPGLFIIKNDIIDSNQYGL